MFRIVLVTTLLVAGLASIPAIAAEDHVAVSADHLKWGPASPALPKGAQTAVLASDPSKDGLYVYRVKVPAGYKVPPHIHPNDENVTVISGTFNVGMGGTFDEKNGQALKAGGFMHMPKGMQHFAWFTKVRLFRCTDGPSSHHLCESGRRSSKEQLGQAEQDLPVRVLLSLMTTDVTLGHKRKCALQKAMSA